SLFPLSETYKFLRSPNNPGSSSDPHVSSYMSKSVPCSCHYDRQRHPSRPSTQQ
ncbi:hypothetical protein SK128_026718, partial [Halocaridina rubra]